MQPLDLYMIMRMFLNISFHIYWNPFTRCQCWSFWTRDSKAICDKHHLFLGPVCCKISAMSETQQSQQEIIEDFWQYVKSAICQGTSSGLFYLSSFLVHMFIISMFLLSSMILVTSLCSCTCPFTHIFFLGYLFNSYALLSGYGLSTLACILAVGSGLGTHSHTNYYQMVSKLVFPGPVRSSYMVSRDPNRDQDRLAFLSEPKIT